MAKGLHNKHISTGWGIAIIGFFIVVLALLIPVLNQQQIGQSHAMYQASESGRAKLIPSPIPSPKKTTCTKSGCFCNLRQAKYCGGGLRCRTYQSVFIGYKKGTDFPQYGTKPVFNASVDKAGQCYN
jgi:hypothetical protein